MRAANFVQKYTGIRGKGFIQPYDKIKATEKWVEYSLDIVDMSHIIMQADFDTKWRLAAALEVVERKRAYMYRHKNFNLKRATTIFEAVKNIPRQE